MRACFSSLSETLKIYSGQNPGLRLVRVLRSERFYIRQLLKDIFFLGGGGGSLIFMYPYVHSTGNIITYMCQIMKSKNSKK